MRCYRCVSESGKYVTNETQCPTPPAQAAWGNFRMENSGGFAEALERLGARVGDVEDVQESADLEGFANLAVDAAQHEKAG